VQPPGKTYKPGEASRKAVIVGRPEPPYTDEARRDQVMGTVVLRAVFGADGYVNTIRVVSGLKGGLTGKAIEAALSLRFFPAEKDGQLISQYIQIEYNFNLY
jgi:TonB family protein